jgi:hypothetical protein
MAKDKTKCKCGEIAEYFQSPITFNPVKTGYCEDCYRLGVLDTTRNHPQDAVTKRRRAKGSGYSGGTGYVALD